MIIPLNFLESYSTVPNSRRLLLSELRDGDYAHAGEEEAIEIVLKKALALNPNLKIGKVLDVGCGFGGTLAYLKTNGFKNLYGVDINKASITYAQEKYTGIHFVEGDALDVKNIFPNQIFNLFILFNSFYAFKDKKSLLSKLAKSSKPESLLAIFDYSCPDNPKDLSVIDFAGKDMRPIYLKQLLQNFGETGWELIATEDLSEKFIIWYSTLLKTLQKEEHHLKQKFSTEAIQEVKDTFFYFLERLKTQEMGGLVVYAQRKYSL